VSNILSTILKYLPFGLLIQSSYSQIQFNYHFHGVVNTTGDFNPGVSITSNPGHRFSLLTYQPSELSNDLFTTHLFESDSSTGSIASHHQITDINCTLADDTLKIIFPRPTDAYYFYGLTGDWCASKGELKITHLRVAGNQLNEVSTITASGFTSHGEENDGSPYTVPPSSNYGKSDVVLPSYTSESQYFSVARALVKLGENLAPLQINVTRADFDSELRQYNLSSEFYDLSNLPNNSLIQWYYTAPNLAVGILSQDSKTVHLNLYSANNKTIHARVDIPQSDVLPFYDMSLHPYNDSAFLLYNRVANQTPNSLDYSLLLHVISTDGKIEYLGSKPTSGISSLLALQKDHGEFMHGGVLLVENTKNVVSPNLTYIHFNRQKSYLLPESPLWLLEDWNDDNAIVESAGIIQIVEMQILDSVENPGLELGSYDLKLGHKPTTQTETPSTNTESISTNRSSFFPSVASAGSSFNSNASLAIGLSAAFVLLIASTAAVTFFLCCRKKKDYEAIRDESIYQVNYSKV